MDFIKNKQCEALTGACNSNISGIISGSMHGWLWLVFAFIGSVLGAKPRVIAGLEKPAA